MGHNTVTRVWYGGGHRGYLSIQQNGVVVKSGYRHLPALYILYIFTYREAPAGNRPSHWVAERVLGRTVGPTRKHPSPLNRGGRLRINWLKEAPSARRSGSWRRGARPDRRVEGAGGKGLDAPAPSAPFQWSPRARAASLRAPPRPRRPFHAVSRALRTRGAFLSLLFFNVSLTAAEVDPPPPLDR